MPNFSHREEKKKVYIDIALLALLLALIIIAFTLPLGEYKPYTSSEEGSILPPPSFKLNISNNNLTKRYLELKDQYDKLLEKYIILSREYEALRKECSSYVNNVTRELMYELGRIHKMLLQRTIIDRSFLQPNETTGIVRKIIKEYNLTSRKLGNEIYFYYWILREIKYSKDQPHPLISYEYKVYPRFSLNITLTYINQFVQSPRETLNRGEGDCEDQAILLASMLIEYHRQVGITNRSVFLIELRFKGERDSGHVAVLVKDRVLNITLVLDPAASYCTITFNENNTSMELENWLNYLKKNLMYRTVTLVELHTQDKTYKFYKVKDFIEWMIHY